jgi:hypothetical protein
MLCLLHKKCYEVRHYSVHPVHVVYTRVYVHSEQATDVFIFWKIFYFVTLTILPFYTCHACIYSTYNRKKDAYAS